jgi:hypothetical protein
MIQTHIVGHSIGINVERGRTLSLTHGDLEARGRISSVLHNVIARLQRLADASIALGVAVATATVRTTSLIYTTAESTLIVDTDRVAVAHVADAARFWTGTTRSATGGALSIGAANKTIMVAPAFTAGFVLAATRPTEIILTHRAFNTTVAGFTARVVNAATILYPHVVDGLRPKSPTTSPRANLPQ